MPDRKLTTRSSPGEIDAFLRQVTHAPTRRTSGRPGRLLFAMDATASRGPTWDRACEIQAQMFRETAALGGLEVQLCYYRGAGEFQFTPWTDRAARLLEAMTGVSCRGGYTQIRKVLDHAIGEAGTSRIDALVFVGDCVEEAVDSLCEQAGRLGILGVPAFMFHEGNDQDARHAFEGIARLTRGACCHFDSGSARELRELLSAVAVYASGGRNALQDFSRDKSPEVRRLVHQLQR